MKIIEHIKSESIKYILSLLFVSFGLLIGAIYQETFQTILPSVIQAMPKSLLMKILLGAIILCVLSWLLSLAFYLKYRNSLIPKFGIYWSKDKEPHCPACKGLMSDERLMKYDNTEYTAFICLKCYPSPKITDYVGLKHNGSFITRAVAMKLFR